MGFEYGGGEKNEQIFDQKRANKWTDVSFGLSGNVYHVSGSGPITIGPLQEDLLYNIISKNPCHIVAGNIGTITASLSDKYFPADFSILHIPNESSQFLSLLNYDGSVVEAWISVSESKQQKLSPLSIFGNSLHSWWLGSREVALSGTGDTGLISSWTDIISGGVAEATTLQEPFTASVGADGLDAINFSGASNWRGLTVPNSQPDYKFLYNGSGSLIAMVLKKDIEGQTQYLLDQAIAAGNRTGITFFIDSSEVLTCRLQNSSGTPMTIATSSIDTNLNYLIFANGANLSPNNKLFVNQPFTPNFSQNYIGTPTGSNSDFELHICARANNERPFLGRVGELILVDGEVDDVQIEKLGKYFSEKYKI